MKAVKGVTRCVSLQGNGTCSRVGPTSVVTNYPVTQLVVNPPRKQSPMFIDEFNVESSRGSQLKRFYPPLSKYEYNGTDNSEVFENISEWILFSVLNIILTIQIIVLSH